MKLGNQFYMELQIFDKDDNILDIASVSKVQINIGSLTKTYDGVNDEVTYDEENKVFKVWLTEKETFEFSNKLRYDVRVKFKNETIMGSYIEQAYVYDSLKQVLIDGDGNA